MVEGFIGFCWQGWKVKLVQMLVAGEEKYLLGKDGFQSEALSIASIVILYSTQPFDAELDLLVMYSRQFCRLGFRCLLLTS